MADLLVLNGSPRTKGNCSYLSRRAAESLAAAGASIEVVALAQKKIGPCTGCDLCRAESSEYCVFKDGMTDIYESIICAKALLFIAPVYWFNYSAQLKLLVDRLYGLWNHDNAFLKGRPVGVALVYGDRDIYSSGGINAIGSFEHMFRFLEADLRGFAYGTANDPDDAEKNEGLLMDFDGLLARLRKP